MSVPGDFVSVTKIPSFAAFLKQEATARIANRRLPVNFKALIRQLMIGGHARQQ
jgi:hypothetical protein